MEDRHYLSEPRPIPGLELPTWEVDVMREGVDTPIMTLTVDNNALPPRKRKKKVVWKLPDDFDTAPKFGKEDRLRILELFKQKKKKLKRQRKSSTLQNGEENQRTLSHRSSSISEGDSGDQEGDPPNGGNPVVSAQAPPGFDMSNLTLSDDKPEVGNGQSCLKDTGTDSQMKRPTNTDDGQKENDESRIRAELEVLESSMNTLPEFPTQVPHTPQQPPSAPLPIPPGMGQTRPPPPPGLVVQPTTPTIDALPIRQFVPPEYSTIAEFVTESYYLLLTRGLVQELSQYYTPTAQKSLTVGGAHAVCTHVEQRVQQLQSLSGMVVNIKGVLQQPTVNGATLILITGTCVQPHTLPFCHSLVLLPVGSVGFQIQNDALCLLTTED